jgi:choline dehydrogenase-like flavoprotein
MGDDRRVVVIGSGPSGAMAAHALATTGIPVTLLESGCVFPGGLLVRLMGRNIVRRRPRWESPKRHVSSDDATALWSHDLVPGGLSNHWTGAVPRFTPEDFYEGERLHERFRWPVQYEELEPYYDRAERLLGVVADPRGARGLPRSQVRHATRLPRQWQEIAVSAESFGQGLTPVPLAEGSPWMVRRRATAFNSYHQIIRQLQALPGFELRLGAHALRLEWCGNTRRVDAVIYYDRIARCERRLLCAAVVVAAGSLSSTKLLLDSACSDFPAGLGDVEGILGRYLHDHAHDMCVIDFDKGLPRLSHPAYVTRAPYHESPPLLGASCTLGARYSRSDRLLTLLPTKSRTFGVIIFGTMVPSEHNYVKLHHELKDEFGFPCLDLHIRYGEEVRRTTVAARDRLITILGSAGYHGTVRWSLPQLTPGSSVHYGGTVRMHSSPKYGMLDGWNRLHAVGNVVVADASCFTTGVEKNPTLTVMALALRAGTRLAEDLKQDRR